MDITSDLQLSKVVKSSHSSLEKSGCPLVGTCWSLALQFALLMVMAITYANTGIEEAIHLLWNMCSISG
ncbi:hypothetical protein GQ602_003391 [Ophiocordyceps camponoti-floridani]|uniref:Uncharacterized protein n=1 Tax=Ophiocordyceps camponoti-floridani TaxID=2030778 RepID=A0A8H4VEG5_9HYPO|nr:hypothetical protein GQ602_003391 [Ophiocordyceps camponoti-floridani]